MAAEILKILLLILILVNDAFSASLDEDYKLEVPEADLDTDLAVILFSSGTTGYPKTIPYTHRMAWEYNKITKASEE